MSLTTRLTDLATRVATECKSLRALINNNALDLSSLTTTAKTNLVAAINELDAAIESLSSGAAVINDSASGTDATWSAQKIAAEILAAKNALTGGAAAALDTLAELATALGNDANFSASVNTALGNRIRFDAAQTLTGPQKNQACANIGVGDPETDFVATFTTGLS